MNITELRLNNWYRQSGKDYILDPMAFIDMLEHWIEFKEVLHEPIPLTEEWLVKFGMGDGIFHGNEHFSIARLYSCKERWGLYLEDEYTAVDFLYVHEFQNLYFALTGEELMI